VNTEIPEWMRRSLSEARLAPYLRVSGGDATRAERLYYWNLEAAAAFYGPLHFLEISLRNSCHRVLSAKYARLDWWTVAPLTRHHLRLIGKANDHVGENARARASRPIVPDDTVAELSFGFWVALLARRYDRHLWVPALHRAFPGCGEPRAALHGGLLSLVLFRNRIMHHEPVHHRDLAADYAKLCRMLGYLEPEAAGRLPELDRVAEVLVRRADVCDGRSEPRL
jgi:hypothetical protein